uniref:Phosphoribulokinase/uridine kinase domain-containing protein n=2 Tax=Tetraselmis chuii TaxID=63592 RepID=A0A7S1T861_9CHLO|mmetsp:Transcript_8510/g.15367  ORF Transcript_8510/g.15367 Transcript_8510/m.15367 type:complete len:322 (+) Transcript_8510:160-1125(+)|eukprot:CAMPEP_0177770230 /NCGR_PEP_ID=MMETSP0491_2-20121128/10802_1 /TAXON_ID=63592 /ORGANISM="Tetraselmis chuii, Strain PLY429" /LENGTH=321 /DNA_ID=CAMNT_0019287407 /DNA_START=112 /DNA_END=1077 /DNA_ORIENTATION=-
MAKLSILRNAHWARLNDGHSGVSAKGRLSSATPVCLPGHFKAVRLLRHSNSWNTRSNTDKLPCGCGRRNFELKASKHVLPTSDPTLLSNRSFVYLEDVVEELADRLLRTVASRAGQGSKKYMVGVTGPPGGGKTTLTLLMERRINERASEYGLDGPASVVPMDGFHYYRKQLDEMDDPVEAHARRGAHWTFDSTGFVSCLKKIVDEGTAKCPSFDHAAGDPVEDAIVVNSSHSIVIVEGNYLLLDLPPWMKLGGIFDETWFVDTDLDVAMERIFERQTGIGMDPEVSRGRIQGNDRPNGELVMGTRSSADIIIPALPMRPR